VATPHEDRLTEAAAVANEVTQRLREVALPETAIWAWWQLLVLPNAGSTPHRIWEAGDYGTLRRALEATTGNLDEYRATLEVLISEHYAERLSQADQVRARLLSAGS